MDKKQSKKQIGLFILYGAVTVFILALILSFNDIGAIFSVMKTADFRYILLAFFCIVAYMLLYPLSLCILTRARGCDIRMSTTYNIAMTEHFFNGITPFATGGQPFQAYAFSKAKVKVSESTSLLLMNFIVFMIVTNAFALCSLFYFNRFVTTTPMRIIAVIGFTMNFLVLVFTFVIATSKKICAGLCRLLDFLCKYKLFNKLLSKKKEELKGYFVNVQTAFADLKRKKGAFFLSLFTRGASMLAYYATTFFILCALRVDVPLSELFYIICGTAFAITMVVFLPTPGSSGGIEFAFKTVFASIAVGATSTVAFGGMLIWRLLTYYLVMFISLGFYIYLEFFFRKKERLKINE